MKAIIAGSRNITSYSALLECINSAKLDMTEVVSGNAKGVDRLGERYAKENDIELKIFPADWLLHGKKAGPIRNKRMAEYAHVLILLWDGESKGSKNMLEEAKKKELIIKEYLYETSI